MKIEIDGYEIKETIANRDDKSIYFAENETGEPRIIKVFQKTYKYSFYENLARLTHPNMPRIHKTLLMEDCFYVLEDYIEGRTLQEILETNGALDETAAINVVMQLCDVLMYLHNQRPAIVHRDITPANIMLTNDGVVKLLDFDIAREHKSDASKDTEVVGTKPFAPPEQYGFTQSDHKADIYSLGILITFMLTNTYDANRIKSRRIKSVVKRCTAFDPKRRYKDAMQLKNRIKLCVAPSKLLQSLINIDTHVYVFPHSRLRILRIIIPIVASYIFMFLLAMTRLPMRGNTGGTSRLEFTLITLELHPQLLANDLQYKIFYSILFAAVFTVMTYVVFGIYDILMFYYFKALQKYYLKRDSQRKFNEVPFIIASKNRVYCTSLFISIAVIFALIPFTGTFEWMNYEFYPAVTVLMTWICCLLGFMLRGPHYPWHYNRAVRHYYKGNIEIAIKYAKKSAKSKRNPARAWLTEILHMEEEKKTL